MAGLDVGGNEHRRQAAGSGKDHQAADEYDAERRNKAQVPVADERPREILPEHRGHDDHDDAGVDPSVTNGRLIGA